MDSLSDKHDVSEAQRHRDREQVAEYLAGHPLTLVKDGLWTRAGVIVKDLRHKEKTIDEAAVSPFGWR